MNKQILKKKSILFLAILVISFMVIYIFIAVLGEDKTADNEISQIKEDEFEKDYEAILKFSTKKKYSVDDYENLRFFDEVEEATNIKIIWDITKEEAWQRRKRVIFLSDTLPDAFYGNDILDDSDVIKYGSEGILIPLEDYIDDYAINIRSILKENDKLKDEITAPNGHIYSLPTVNEGLSTVYDILFINKTWVDSLNMPLPDTIEDFYKVLKAFSENDMNGNGIDDEIPFTFLDGDICGGIHSLFGAFGILDNLEHIVLNDNEQVVCSATQIEYKKAIKYFNRLYTEGLIDPEAFTHNSKVYINKIRDSQKIVGAFMGWSLGWAFANTQGDYVAIPPLKGLNNKRIWNKQNSRLLSKSSFSITKDNRNVLATIKWIDHIYDEKVSFQSLYGLIGVSMKENKDGTFTAVPPPPGLSYEEFSQKYIPGAGSVYCILEEYDNKLLTKDQEKILLDEMYEPYLPKKTYTHPYFTIKENEKVVFLESQIVPYINEQKAKWIMMGEVEKEWNDYILKLEELGINELIDIHRKAYKRYSSHTDR